MASLKYNIRICILFLLNASCLAYVPPRFEMKRLSNVPLISSWNNNSDFLYNYNSGFMPSIDGSQPDALLVRVQDIKNGSKSIYDVGPSRLAISRITDKSYLNYSYVSRDDVVIDVDLEYQSQGVEDPRVILYNNTYYVLYTALGETSDHKRVARLALTTCQKNCFSKAGWNFYGPLFSDQGWSKSGSLLVHNETHRYLFYGDSSISIAVTKDLIHYDHAPGPLITTRGDHFDSVLVEAGPNPLKLSDNNYLFLYNSGRHVNDSNPKPDWNIQYNLGWLILNGTNPTQIIARSEDPILSPELDWERCDNNSGAWASRGLTPLVVFIEGWKQIAVNTFLIWYQGCDSVMGLAQLTVSF